MTFSSAQLKAVKTIIVHGPGCPDGVASAILLHDVLPEAEIKFVQYGTDEHKNLPATSGMLFADFSPPAERVQEFVEVRAIVLDHHKTAKSVVAAFGDLGVFGDEVSEPGVCGAVLAYRHIWLPLQAERAKTRIDGYGQWMTSIQVAEEESAAKDFATLAGIRDTWQNKSPRWHEALIQAEMVRFYPVEHWLRIVRPFDPSNKALWTERRQITTLLIEKHEKSVQKVIEKAHRFTSKKGTRVVVFEGTHLSSDAAEALGKEADIVIGFAFLVENGEQKMIVSSRSHSGYDVSAFSKHYGGGGHTAAAGFNAKLSAITVQPYKFVELLVEDYEQK